VRTQTKDTFLGRHSRDCRIAAVSDVSQNTRFIHSESRRMIRKTSTHLDLSLALCRAGYIPFRHVPQFQAHRSRAPSNALLAILTLTSRVISAPDSVSVSVSQIRCHSHAIAGETSTKTRSPCTDRRQLRKGPQCMRLPPRNPSGPPSHPSD
jgi:hypothetical protein